MTEIDVSNFCLVCYYDKETNKLARIENYTNNSSDIEADIKSYEYGYNAVVVKPEQLMGQLQQLKAERDLLLRQLVVLDGEDVTVQITQEQFDEYNKLKVENEKLKNEIKEIREDCDVCFNAPTILEQKYKQCLDEIEEIANTNYGTILEFYEANKKILQKIKEVRGNR